MSTGRAGNHRIKATSVLLLLAYVHLLPPNMTTGATRELQVAAGPFPLGHLSVETTKTSKSNYGKGEEKV